jgi:PAS domain S-box-containing protein
MNSLRVAVEDHVAVSAHPSFPTALNLLQSGNLLPASVDSFERKRAEQIGKLMTAIVDSSDDAIISKNLIGIITTWNKGAERLFGYSREEAVGQHIQLIVPESRREEEAAILAQLNRGERVNHFETLRQCKDGTLLNLSITISLIRDDAGQVVGASKVARDITERKHVEQSLRQSEERLRTLSNSLEAQVRTRTRELEERNTEILQQAEQLRELSNRLLQTQDDERRHIARELHDSAGQLIAALAMNLAGIAQHAKQNPAQGKIIEDSQNLIQQLNSEIRTTSYLLHPPLLDEAGLPQAIEWYQQGLKDRSALDLQLAISEDFGRLPADLELTIFRIVQEALTNIHRHSGSKTATIRLSRTADAVLLEVEDHGKGIPAHKLAAIRAQRTGIGITGMRERVRYLKGVMDIHSDGAGATVSAKFPLVSETADSQPLVGSRFG